MKVKINLAIFINPHRNNITALGCDALLIVTTLGGSPTLDRPIIQRVPHPSLLSSEGWVSTNLDALLDKSVPINRLLIQAGGPPLIAP
jgi:hypothetical protein